MNPARRATRGWARLLPLSLSALLTALGPAAETGAVELPLSGVSEVSGGGYGDLLPNSFTCAVAAGGAWCWGQNYFGQLGDGKGGPQASGEIPHSSRPSAPIGLSTGVDTISAGSRHACAVTLEGDLWCWGGNPAGQLGDGGTDDRTTPVLVEGLPSVASVSAGFLHTCAVTRDGEAWCWGHNYAGQLGDGTTETRGNPAPVVGLSGPVAAISAGWGHTCAATVGGEVWCWGRNDEGQLGWGYTQGFPDSSTPVHVARLEDVEAVAVSVGGLHTCALAGNGEVWCWGSDEFGQVGHPNPFYLDASNPIRPSQLDGPAIAIDAGEYGTCAVTVSGELDCWGLYNSYAPTSGVVAFATGPSHGCVVLADTTLRCSGSNDSGELGDGGAPHVSLVPKAVRGLPGPATAVGASLGHACAVVDGIGWCWGSNYSGQLGDGNDFSTMPAIRYPSWHSPPVAVVGLAEGAAIDPGGYHTCALTPEGVVWCWGGNYFGQLGDGAGEPSPTLVRVDGIPEEVAAISAGVHHSCGITRAGNVWCWGANFDGQLGAETGSTRPSPPVLVEGLPAPAASISAGKWHSCVLTIADEAWCWGPNYYGEVGDGTKTRRSTPVAVVGLPGPVRAIAAGEGHTCALGSEGDVWCWGRGEEGQLGFGRTTQLKVTPVLVSGFPSPAVTISAMGYRSCAGTSENRVWCWGAGPLGNGSHENSGTPVAVVGPSAVALAGAGRCALTVAGGVRCWGENRFGTIGDGWFESRSYWEPVVARRACGDVDASGAPDLSDAVELRRALAGSATLSFPGQCNVVGPQDTIDRDGDVLPDDCNVADAVVLRRAARDLQPGLGTHCVY